MSDSYNDLLKTILLLIEKQAEAINRLSDAYLNMADEQSGVVKRQEKMIEHNETWLVTQRALAERQEKILNKYQDLLQKLASFDADFNRLEAFTRDFYDLYFDELNELRKRVTALENEAAQRAGGFSNPAN